MKSTIVIIAYKNLDESMACAHRVRETTMPWSHDIFVKDNSEKNENIHIIWNRELKYATTKYFCVLNPDTKPEHLWLHHLMDLMERFPLFGGVGPSTNRCYNEQSGRIHDIVKHATHCYVPGVLIPGFCALYRTDYLRKIGGWRECFDFYGGDIDLAYRLRLAGHETAWCVPAYVHHDWGGAAKALGPEEYAKLRETGNIQLHAAIKEYTKPGIWYACGKEVKYAEEGPRTSEEATA